MIEAHIIAFNEAETIHLTIKHYQSFCDRIIIWDNHSTDNTREIARLMTCTVKTFGVKGELSDRAYMELKNECWKKSHPGQDRRDWVVVVDADEILLYDSKKLYFNGNATIVKTQGWNVFSHEMPVDNWMDITTGYPDENYSKNVIFAPRKITDINYHIGGHVCKPRGDVFWANETLYLLHYRNVGGPQRLVDRHNLYWPRMSKENLHRNWGHHYLVTDEERIAEWELKYQKSKPL
jgi:glycosyltransferase involved in cell wall biosynthesis